MPPTRKAIGRGLRRQSARKMAVPAKESRKQTVNLLVPNVDSLDNQDAMDTLVDKLVDKLGSRVEALVDRKLRQHAGQSIFASPAHSQRSSGITVPQCSSDSQSQTEPADVASSQDAATSPSVARTTSEPALSLDKFLPTI